MWDTITIIGLTLVGTLFGFAALFAGIGYFRQGKNQGELDKANIKLNTNTLLKEQIDALETKVNTQTTDIEKMGREIHELKNAVEEKDKKIDEFMKIFQGRDPQMTAFITTVTKYIESNVPLLESIKMHTIPTIENLQKYLDKQTF